MIWHGHCEPRALYMAGGRDDRYYGFPTQNVHVSRFWYSSSDTISGTINDHLWWSKVGLINYLENKRLNSCLSSARALKYWALVFSGIDGEEIYFDQEAEDWYP